MLCISHSEHKTTQQNRPIESMEENNMKMKKITTVYLNEKACIEETEREFIQEDEGHEVALINIYPEIREQEFLGFGGAFTEAAGYTLSKMSEEIYSDIIEDYFGEGGLSYSFCRTHIDSCDFSLDNYSAVSDPDDYDLKTFSLERDKKYIIPMIKRAQKTGERKINLVLSPWSPPAFMKTNNQKNKGGKLKTEYRQLWAEYMSRYVKEYCELGINVVAVTVQNEPMAVQSWDSCIYTPEEEGIFVSEFLAPQLKKDGLENIGIIIWDHNKERVYERSRDVFKVKNCENNVWGIGFHWYTGDHFENLDIVKKLYPDKKLIFTEACVEYSKFSSQNQLRNAQMYAHDIIGNFNAGMNAFIDWNMVLDEKGGPNHVNNFCDAPIMCDTANGTYEKKLSYNYLGHFSRHIVPRAVKIAHSRYTDKLEVVAFKNPDEKIVIIILNRTEESLPYTIRMNERICNAESEPSSISTLIVE